uniref:Uncharacterized protein n=1 Tax=Eutreptiella gymnastica TaxID=73025 RepID=A0A7S4CJ18_9EUGL
MFTSNMQTTHCAGVGHGILTVLRAENGNNVVGQSYQSLILPPPTFTKATRQVKDQYPALPQIGNRVHGVDIGSHNCVSTDSVENGPRCPHLHTSTTFSLLWIGSGTLVVMDGDEQDRRQASQAPHPPFDSPSAPPDCRVLHVQR